MLLWGGMTSNVYIIAYMFGHVGFFSLTKPFQRHENPGEEGTWVLVLGWFNHQLDMYRGLYYPVILGL